MKKLIYLIALLIIPVIMGAASSADDSKKINIEKPDLAKIKTEIMNPKSRYYYPELMKQFLKADTSMTVNDYRYLYLGAMFQEDYNPYRKSDYRERIQELYYRNNHTRPELDSIIAYAELSLADDPFDLEQMTYLIYALRGRGKNFTANIWQYRLNHILLAILSTGTGLDPENAWYVINPRHEYNIINFQNRTVESQEFREPYYEYIKLAPPTDGSASRSPEGYFFNIHTLLEEYYRKHPEQL